MSIFPAEHGAALRRRVEANLGRFDRLEIVRSGAKAAAVAVTLLPDEEGAACFLLTRRAAHLKRHAGQWALPGGRRDGGERVHHTALRELHEEVGLELAPSTVLGFLDDYSTRSGFVITPVIVWCEGWVELAPDPSEVAHVFRIPLSDLDRPDVPFLSRITESDRPVISMPIGDRKVHAPTAAILYQLLEVALRGNLVRVAHYEQPVFAWR